MVIKNKNNNFIKNEFNKVQTKWQAVSLEKEDDYDFSDIFIKQEHTAAPAKKTTENDEKNPLTEQKNFDNQDLSNKDFSNQDLTGASFKNCNLTGADFTNATLKDANFTGANLSQAILKGADIENAILVDINIDELGLEELQGLIEYLAKYYPHKLNLHLINLTLLDLRRIDLSKINLKGVDFTGCDMTGVNIIGLDLSSCIISPEQINQALGRPPTALEFQQMFMPKKGKGGLNLSNFAKQMEQLFQGDGSTWGVWDATKDKGIAVESLMKMGKKIFKTLSGKPEPKLEDMQAEVQKNMDSRIKSKNQEKKQAIEELKRKTLEKLQQPTIEEPTSQKDITHKKIISKEVSQYVIQKARSKERA